LLPPVGPLWLILGGAAIAARLPRFGLALFVLGLLTVVGLSLPVVADLLQTPFEKNFPPWSDSVLAPKADAIVVLGAGRNLGALEFGGETVSGNTLERVRYAARVARRTHLPVLVTGGKPDGGTSSEAQLMAETLLQDFGVEVRWIEPNALNTAQNASRSIALLESFHVHRVLLVTDVVQMRRAKFDFEARGMPVIPAPMNFRVHHIDTIDDFIPQASAYARSAYILREYLAYGVARLADRSYQ